MNNMTENENSIRILSRALKMELFSHRIFFLLENRVCDEECRDILKRLAVDERAHSTFLMSELEMMGERSSKEAGVDQEQILKKGISAITRGGPVSIFEQTINLKQKMIDFYRVSLKAVSDNGIRKILSKFIEMEEKHKRILNMSLIIARENALGQLTHYDD